MGEKTKINGFETYSQTRRDTISDRKKTRGVRATTFSTDPEKKQKLNFAVNTNFNENKQLKEMLGNPHFGVSKIEGAGISEKQLVHGYRFQHSTGEIDFLNIEAVEIGDYGIKINQTFLDNDDWQWIMDEPFRSTTDDPVGVWTDNGAIPTHTVSGGDYLQVKNIDWHEFMGTADTSTSFSVEGDQSLRLGGGDGIRAQLNKLYSYYELTFYSRFNYTGSGGQYLFFGQSGYNASIDKYFNIKFDGYNDLIDLEKNGVEISSVDFIFDHTVWYHIKLLVLGTKVLLFIDGELILSETIPDLYIGDIAFRSGTGTYWYIDRVRMKVLPFSVIGLPPYCRQANSYAQRVSVDGFYGNQDRVFQEDLVKIEHGISQHNVLQLEFEENTGVTSRDLTPNENNALIRSGRWVDGYLGKGIKLINGDIQIADDASISDLSEFMLHIRFKLTDLNMSSNGFDARVIASKGSEWVIYDHKIDGSTTHNIAFEIFGELLVGDEILEGIWYEFYFLCDGKSSFIYRSDSTGIIQPEARKILGDLRVWLPLDIDEDDKSINQIDATNNGIAFVTGKLNNAGDFEQSESDYIDLGNVLSEQIDMSFTFWIKRDSATSGDNFVICKYDVGNGYSYGIYYNHSGGSWQIYAGAGGSAFSGNSDLGTSTEWFHIIVTKSDTTWTLYINNVFIGTAIRTSAASTGNANIGRRPDGSFYWDGLIDDIRFYNKVLSIEERTFLFSKGNYTNDLNINSMGYEVSNNIQTIDYLSLGNKFIIPYKHMNSLFNVRCWKLPEDNIGNPMMRSLIWNIPFEEGSGSYSKIKNIYDANAYIDNVNFNTDTFSSLQKASYEFGANDSVTLFDNTDIVNNARIYEFSISFWIKILNIGNYNYLIKSRNDTDTFGIYIIIIPAGTLTVGYGWDSGYDASVITHDINPYIIQWKKVDWTFNHGINKLYIDGELVETLDHSATTTWISKGISNWNLDNYSTDADAYIDLWKMYDRALTSDEIKQQFISDPLEPYYLQELIFSSKHLIDKNDAIFIENGLFGVHLHKGLYVEGLRTIGKVEFVYWDKGWEPVGHLRVRENALGINAFGLKNFQILQITPLKQTIRVWLAGEDDPKDGYQDDQLLYGSNFVFDIILEAGKYGATIIPRSQVHPNDFRVEMLYGLYGSAYPEVCINGFTEVSFGEVGIDLENTSAVVPLFISFRKNNNLLLGFGCNKDTGSLYADVDTAIEEVKGVAFRNVDDPHNETYIFTVFAKKYNWADESPLLSYKDCGDPTDLTGTGFTPAPIVDDTGLGVYQLAIVASEWMRWTMPLMKKGSYMMLARMTGNMSDPKNTEYHIHKNGTSIESYGFNIGASDTFTLLNVWTDQWDVYPLFFNVDDETATYSVYIKSEAASIVMIDCLIIVPLANRKSSVMDLYHQAFTINNQKYVGIL